MYHAVDFGHRKSTCGAIESPGVLLIVNMMAGVYEDHAEWTTAADNMRRLITSQRPTQPVALPERVSPGRNKFLSDKR